MATLKRQKSNGEWEYIQVVGSDTISAFDAHLADYVRQPAFAATTGVSAAYTVTLNPVPTSIADGFGITIVPHVDSGADPTLNINGLGAISLKTQSGEAMTMLANTPYSFKKVGADFLADSSGGLDEFFGDGSDGALDTSIAQSYPIPIVSAPSGGVASNIIDGNNTTYLVSDSGSNNRELAKIDFKIPVTIKTFTLRQSKSLNGNCAVRVEYSCDNTNWFNFGDYATLTSSYADYVVTALSGIAINARYWRVFQWGTTTTTISIGEAQWEYAGGSFNFATTINTDIIIKQYESINIRSGHIVSTTNPCQGLILYSKNSIDIAGSIDMSKKAGISNGDTSIPMIITKLMSNGLKNLEKYLQVTNFLQTLKGGSGGNGGNSYLGTIGGIGGTGRINLGGFGGGGAGGRYYYNRPEYGLSLTGVGGMGGSITNPSICGSNIVQNFTAITYPGGGSLLYGYSYGLNGVDGNGGNGGWAKDNNNNGNSIGVDILYGGKCNGGGGGGSGGGTGGGAPGEYAGGLIGLICAGNINITGSLKANGGSGGGGGLGSSLNYGSTYGAGGGGGGGAGGGVVAIYYKGTITNNGTIQANGGGGGGGGIGYLVGTANPTYNGLSGTSGSVGTIHIQQL